MRSPSFRLSAAHVLCACLAASTFAPRVARAQSAPFKYAVFMRQGNGVLQPSFWPSAAGALTTSVRTSRTARRRHQPAGR